jgi:predicted cupin superfamily sugar epimerase
MTHPWITELGLQRHPEGGWFAETWRSAHTFTPTGYAGPRAAATGIYFALFPGEESAWHVVRSDELWLWHAGGPLALRLGGSGDAPAPAAESTVLGPDVAGGARPQVRVPGGVWQSAAPLGDDPVLVSCVVAPGFDFADFRMV